MGVRLTVQAHRFNSRFRRIPYATGQLGKGTTITEAHDL